MQTVWPPEDAGMLGDPFSSAPNAGMLGDPSPSAPNLIFFYFDFESEHIFENPQINDTTTIVASR